MASTIDGMISEKVEAAVAKAMARALAPLAKEIKALRLELEEKRAGSTMVRESLITMTEAQGRLGVGAAKLREIVGEGGIVAVRTPGGTRKVMESSLNAYIQSLGKEGAA